jgi:uncharacterized membrane protein
MPHTPIMIHPDVKSIDQLRAERKPINNVTHELRQKLSPADHVAIWITQHIGTMGFFGLILTWTVLWLTWNTMGPREYRFDPFPGFVLWLFISNMIQICLMPLIMIGQNIQGAYAETRSQSDYEVNVQAEREIETILLHLENQNKLILEILKKLGGEKNPQKQKPRL